MSIAKPAGQAVQLPRQPWLSDTTLAWLTDAVQERHVRPRDMLALLLVDLVGCPVTFAATLMRCHKGHVSRRVRLTRARLAELPPPAGKAPHVSSARRVESRL